MLRVRARARAPRSCRGHPAWGNPWFPHEPPPSGASGHRPVRAAVARRPGGSTSPRSTRSGSSRAPGVIVGASTGTYPARLRAAGAKTVYWDMYLNRRVGQPSAPANPDTIETRANSLFDFAAAQSGCEKPIIALNELFGAHLETPWTASNQRYRENVLAFVRQLASRGARPFLLISTRPYTGSDEAAAWWREVAKVADLVPEVYFGGPSLYVQGPIVASRRIRVAMRDRLSRFLAIGIPAVAPRRRPRVPDRARRRRARGPAAGRGLVRGDQVAGARRAAGRHRVPDRLGLVVGVGDATTATPTTTTSRTRCACTCGRARPGSATASPRPGRPSAPRGRRGRSACRRRGSAGSSAAAASTPARSASCSR